MQTGDCSNLLPLFWALSGFVITPTTLREVSLHRALNIFADGFGVPANKMFIKSFIFS